MAIASKAAKRAKSAAAYVPRTSSLRVLRDASGRCHGCDLYRFATQTVFGEGRTKAPLMFVGEEPGDVEDTTGHPFVGPAGTLLRKAMAEVPIAERDVYLTNAVKHFKFIERGKRRIHVAPKTIEIRACSPWLEAELRLLRPKLVVALGATAAQALLGPGFEVTKQRGKLLASPLAAHVMATVHPSSVLRSANPAERRDRYRAFVADLRRVAATLERLQA